MQEGGWGLRVGESIEALLSQSRVTARYEVGRFLGLAGGAVECPRLGCRGKMERQVSLREK